MLLTKDLTEIIFDNKSVINLSLSLKHFMISKSSTKAVNKSLLYEEYIFRGHFGLGTNSSTTTRNITFTTKIKRQTEANCVQMKADCEYYGFKLLPWT